MMQQVDLLAPDLIPRPEPLTVSHLLLAWGGLLGVLLLVSLWQGPVYATVQNIAPAHMRATAASIFLFIANLIGLGLGPLAVGLASDVLAVNFGMGSAEGVRWALIGSQFLVIPAFVCFWLARRTIREEMEE